MDDYPARAEDYPARAERTEICALLTELGPDGPTLCDGWSTRDLAAHLVLRERRPLAAPGIAFRPLAGYTARVHASLVARPFESLVDTLRRPPRWSLMTLPPVDRVLNTVEMFVHHEDIRRAQPDWQPRPLSPALGRQLWSQLRGQGKLRLRRFPATVVLEAPDYGNVRTGRGGEEVRVSGDPGELALFLTGRKSASRAEVTGPEQLADRLRHARLSL